MADKVELYDDATLLGTDNAPVVVNGTLKSWSIDYIADVGSDALTAKYYVNDVLKDTSPVINVTGEAAGGTEENIVWTQLVNATNDGNGTITRTSTSNTGYNNGGIATKGMNGTNSVKFTAENLVNHNQLIGLEWRAHNVATGGLNMRISAIANNVTGTIIIYEDGAEAQNSQPWASNDVIELLATDNGNSTITVTVKKNGATFYTSAKTFAFPLTPIAKMLGGASGAASQIINARFTDSSNLVQSTI